MHPTAFTTTHRDIELFRKKKSWDILIPNQNSCTEEEIIGIINKGGSDEIIDETYISMYDIFFRTIV